MPPLPPNPAKFHITTPALPQGSVGVPYNASVAAALGVPPYAFSITAGALPPGLSMSGAGAITGTPTASANFSFTVQATDADSNHAAATLSIDILAGPEFTTPSLPDGAVGVAYNSSISVIGGATPYTFSITGGSLPPGLVLGDNGGISGVPTAVGVFQFLVEVSDSSTPAETQTTQYSITIAASEVASPVAAVESVLILGGADGGLYCIEEGQYHDQNAAGDSSGYMAQWQGVPTSNPGLTEMQLGGATVAGKGRGALNINAVDDRGNIYGVTTPTRPFVFLADDNNNPVETIRDFVTRGLPHRTKWGMSFDNGGVADAWFELHQAIFYTRPIATARRG